MDLKTYSTLAREALLFAYAAHAGQKRKYTGEPYINHPIAVADLVAEVTEDQEMIAAALLHDVVEDTEIEHDDILRWFGERVAMLVWHLTDISRPEDGNRAKRKAMDRTHIAQAPVDAKTVKLADLIDNSSTITKYDPHFSVVYMREKRALLEKLQDGDYRLLAEAQGIVDSYFGTVK